MGNPFAYGAGEGLRSKSGGGLGTGAPDRGPGVGYETRRQELRPEVRSYADRLYARIKGIYGKYGVSSVAELRDKISTGKNSKGLKPGELKSDSAELSKLADKLRGLLERGDFAPGEEFELKKETLYESERAKLSAFFERGIEVPPLPEWITPEKMEGWERKILEIHYLPPVDMSREGRLKGWVKPDFSNINVSDLPPDAMLLPGCWVLVDGRPKPKYESGNQRYGNDSDFLEPALESLRDRDLIKKSERPRSRFDISPEELEKPKVVAALAEAMGLAPGTGDGEPGTPEAVSVSLPRMIEFNVIGNVHHPEWGEPPSDCGEWFADRYQAGRSRLGGGHSGGGGLAYVDWNHPGSRGVDVGFRVLGRFS